MLILQGMKYKIQFPVALQLSWSSAYGFLKYPAQLIIKTHKVGPHWFSKLNVMETHLPRVGSFVSGIPGLRFGHFLFPIL